MSKQFITLFYQKLLILLNDESRLQQALSFFQQNNQDNERYLCRETLGLSGWNKENASKFSAAVAEALRETTLHFFTTDETELKQLQSCSDAIKKSLIPKLTEDLNANNPFDELKLKIQEELKQLTQGESSFKNPYVLFGGATAAAVVAAVVWNLTKP